MSKHFRPWNIDQTLLLPPNVRDFVPKDHAGAGAISCRVALAVAGVIGPRRGCPVDLLLVISRARARSAPPGGVELTVRVSSCTEVAAGAGGISCRVALAIAARSIRL